VAVPVRVRERETVAERVRAALADRERDRFAERLRDCDRIGLADLLRDRVRTLAIDGDLVYRLITESPADDDRVRTLPVCPHKGWLLRSVWQLTERLGSEI
jgi:hypothetical protein